MNSTAHSGSRAIWVLDSRLTLTFTFLHLDFFSLLTCKQEEDKHHNEGIAKVEESAGESLNLQLGHVVMYTVDEEIHGGEATGQERAPPPVIVLKQMTVMNTRNKKFIKCGGFLKYSLF